MYNINKVVVQVIKNMSIKILISFIAIILLVNIFYIPASHAMGDIMQSGKNFLYASPVGDTPLNENALKTTSSYVYNILLSIAIIVAVIVAMVLGIQFMVAAADEKAKIKEAIMPFIAGCIVVFGAFTIWKIAVSIGNSAEDSIIVSKRIRTNC